MKKFIFGAAVIASAFFAASCQQEMLEPQAEGNTVTYTVEIPNAIATKAIGDQITAVDKVYYEVYRAAEVEDLSKSPVYQGEEPVINNSASFDLEFVKNQEFVVLFWAQNSALVNTDVTSEEGMYNINDLRKIQLVNPGAANNDAAQVFAGSDRVSNCASAANGNVTLTRPVSQINVYTTTESLSFGDLEIGLSTSDMTVAGLYNTYNVATGDAVDADENESTFVYAEAAVPTATADNAALKYVAMNYVGFAPKNGTTVNVGFNIQTTEAVKIKHSVSNVPVKPNFRTNITGNLITATTDYNVTLDNKWSNAEITYATNAEAAQAALDNAAAGTVIKLHPGVNYGTLYMRPVEGGAQTKVVDWIGNNYGFETYSLFENITIIGAEGATVDAIEIEGGTYYYTEHSQAATYPVMLSLVELKNVVFDGVTFTGKGGYDPQGYGNAVNLSGNNIKVDGLTFKNCVLNNSENKARLLYKTESTTHVHSYSYDGETYSFIPSLKDITITGCTLNGGYMGLELRETENVTITNNEFNVADRNILLAVNTGCTYSGIITITGNVSNNAKERFVRADGTGDAVVVITGNTINNYLADDADYIKVTGGGNNVTIENNTISVGAQDAASAQTALDNAVPGDKIQLQPGVNYGTLKFRANPGHSNTTLDEIADAWRYNYSRSIEDITIIGAEGAKVDGFVFETGALPGDCNNRVTVNNLVIDGVEFTDALTAAAAGYNAPIMITTSNATIDGLTVKNCKLIGDNNKLNLVYLYAADGSKNVSLINNEVEGVARLCELRGTENVTLTGNVIKNTYEHAMLLAGGGYAGNVTITGNTADGIRDRFVRMAGAGNAAVLIKDNNIYNYKGADADYIKVTDGTNVTIENNVFGRIVYGLTIIPNGENSKIIVKDKEGFLNLTRLFAEWTALFTDGNGNEVNNYASGAGVDYYFGDRWTISLEADIDLNNETISPVILKHPKQTGRPTFDGNNHTIKNAKIVTDATTENKAGLFDATYAALKNLKLDNIHVTGSNVGNSTAGILSGEVNANAQYITITNSSVTGGKYTGGITGYGYTDVTNCSLTNVTVKGGYKLGGVIGYICAEEVSGNDVTGNTLTDCTVDGIGGGIYAGGKSEYIIGKVVGNYNCNGTCSNNTITNMTTSATTNIGKIEGSFTVQE